MIEICFNYLEIIVISSLQIINYQNLKTILELFIILRIENRGIIWGFKLIAMFGGIIIILNGQNYAKTTIYIRLKRLISILKNYLLLV